MANTIVRPYRLADRDAVRRICYETGQLGNSVEPYYKDFESFADIFAGYYVDREPQYAFVAERDGKVIGYLVSCLDTRKAAGYPLVGLKHALLRGVCFRPGTAWFYWRGLWDLSIDLFNPKRPRFDMARYPSHTHNNLLPEGRGQSISTDFYFRAFDALKLAGSPGLHVEVTSVNHHMLGFITNRLGFHLYGDPYPVPAGRLEDGGRIHLQLALRDLTSWVPGAWRLERERAARQSA
jgi:hypothetical protein